MTSSQIIFDPVVSGPIAPPGASAPWKNVRWYVLDARGAVCARFRKTSHSEARRLAAILFCDEGLKLIPYQRASRDQKRAGKKFLDLTPSKCAELLKPLDPNLIGTIIDRKMRGIKS